MTSILKSKTNSQNLKPSAISAMQLHRAQRKPREEWEKYRERLEKLYVQEGTCRKDIISIMAKEHGFVIT